MFSQWVLPTVPSPSRSTTDDLQTPAASPSTEPRRSPRTTEEKLDDVLKVISATGWSLGEFLYHLFQRVEETQSKPRSKRPDPVAAAAAAAERVNRRSQVLRKFLSGEGNYKPLLIITLIYNHKFSRPSSEYNDDDHYFSHTIPSSDIDFAKPALTTWALELLVQQVRRESNRLVSREAGLRARASTKKRSHPIAATITVAGPRTVDAHAVVAGRAADAGPGRGAGIDEEDRIAQGVDGIGDTDSEESEDDVPQDGNRDGGRTKPVDPMISWDLISGFSLAALEEKYRALAPVTWHILWEFMKPDTRGPRIYRPTHIVSTSIISEMVYGRNQHANLFALCRGISLFAMKAHHAMFRVGSRLAQNVPYSTMRRALVQMADEKRAAWARDILLKILRFFLIVLDNIQAYALRRDQRIGNGNEMIIGTGATAIEMQDCSAEDFNLEALKVQRAKNERANVTVEKILADVDMEHLKRVGSYHWIDALVYFVPALQKYRPVVDAMFQEQAKKHQIDPKRRSKIHPLGTNSANEVTTQGMKAAVADFVDQIGLTEETYGGNITFVTGDGKSFEGLNKVKKYLDSLSSDFSSFRFVESMLELWHTKWTDLSRVCRAHWGRGLESTDPSTLGFMAKVIHSSPPSDLKTVDFYTNSRLMNVVVKTHMLHCWELHFGTDNLPKHFENLAMSDKLPTIQQITMDAAKLYKTYSTTEAHEFACESLENLATQYPQAAFPIATTRRSVARTTSKAIEEGVAKNGGDTDAGSEGDQSSEDGASGFDSGDGDTPKKGDWVLANSILLMRDGIWFLEVCRAVASGDIGRVWEVLKIWIFTFAGAGNTNYTAYLTEMWCKLTYEFPAGTRKAFFNNWLVNLTGKKGNFMEMDLMQEHFNFWLEDLAQHKGKEFSDEWYRDVLSMHVYHFLRLKEEMEATVELAAVSKQHISPHLDNEFLAALRVCREYDMHTYHEGRDYGHHSQDNFTAGVKLLGRKGKLAAYIDDTIRGRGNATEVLVEPKDAADASTYMRPPMQYVDGRLVIPSVEPVNH
ncbi:hypothetical protein BV25DRAFT_1996352 [Artomyces pyxidatus]|uniref:Uncharacterized protein n=1 Tax=Artomyces pyxidatus TaxID=48021 RepID=A0ACB8SFD5_9AGAM|nr:hypothetical protein BV25DRAFT_1996352 [Artomyces pyxidatus]